MDRRTVLAVVLSLAVWYGWLAVRGPTKPPGAETDPNAEPAPSSEPVSSLPLPAPSPAPAPSINEQKAAFRACGAEGWIGTDGGRLHGLDLPEHDAPYQVTPLYQWLYQSAFSALTGSAPEGWHPYGADPGPEILLSDDARALAVGVGQSTVQMQLAELQGPLDQPRSTISLQGRTPEGVLVTQRFSERREGESCYIEVAVSFDNQSPGAVIPSMGLHDHVHKSASRYDTQLQPVALADGSVYYGGALGAGCVRTGTQLSDKLPLIPLPSQVSWFALADRYFGLYVVLPADTKATASLARIGAAEEALDGTMLRWPDLAPGAKLAETYRVYAGPNHTHALEAVDPSLSRAVDLGWFAFFGYPMLALLRLLYSVAGNWGVAIILLTVIVKALFFPMTQRSMRSMQRMSLIQPELAAIKEKYADNPAEMNRLTIELMQKNEVNPLTGCLPMFVQMPVWIALYNVILTSADLYHTKFLYLDDLSKPDPYCILPVTITFLMWAQQQLSTPPANMDPAQQQVMKVMPLMFGLMFFAFPSGLAVYTFVNMTLSILQQWVIKRSLQGSAPASAAAS